MGAVGCPGPWRVIGRSDCIFRGVRVYLEARTAASGDVVKMERTIIEMCYFIKILEM